MKIQTVQLKNNLLVTVVAFYIRINLFFNTDFAGKTQMARNNTIKLINWLFI